MDLVGFGLVVALLATLYSFVGGVVSMARHGEVLHHTSEEWMTMRVVFQGLAVLLLLVLFFLK
ncbi:MAG TPA: HIG1 domain-containing protein [Burkholderiaceae bacterium]|nr:HIG1 domain-containing protein [Burkholderiaceae bacterium]